MLQSSCPLFETAAKIATKRWEFQEFEVKTYPMGKVILLHIPTLNTVEIFTNHIKDLSNPRFSSMLKALIDHSNITVCLPLKELGKAHEEFYQLGITLQGFSEGNGGIISFFPKEYA